MAVCRSKLQQLEQAQLYISVIGWLVKVIIYHFLKFTDELQKSGEAHLYSLCGPFWDDDSGLC